MGRSASLSPSWCPSFPPSTSAPLCPRRLASSSSASQGRWKSPSRLGGALTPPLLLPERTTMRKMPSVIPWELHPTLSEMPLRPLRPMASTGGSRDGATNQNYLLLFIVLLFNTDFQL